MKTLQKIETWLPVFSGFYGTLWETDHDEEMELEYINDHRKDKGLAPITWDDAKWDYMGYRQNVCKSFTRYIEGELQKLNMVSSVGFQNIVSPREYNFTNDSVNISIELSEENKRNISKYLNTNKEVFTKYIRDTYTSRSGFMSHYSNNALQWLIDMEETLTHGHKLGAVLNFILLNEDDEMEMAVYERLKGNGCTLEASNYSELTGGE